jgi:putative oxygen-independent coproporphyrinogen III oxidase
VISHHLYLHVPFCRLVCPYCDFVTVGGRAETIPAYVAALIAELSLRDAPGALATIYFGGGTPSLLSAAAVERLVRTAVERWGRDPVEVTLEANPSAREAPDWRGLRAAGVNRLSLGVQSLRDAELAELARGHSAAESRAAFAAARAAGFDNISIDLIYAIPGQTLAAWRDGLQAALELAPEHISLYALQLVLEPDEWAAPPRPGALRWRRRSAGRQDDGAAADQYRLAEQLLENAGYDHYELSSWARPGRASLHNAAYWDRLPYTGLGAGAHSYDGAVRSWNTRDLERYLSRIAAGERATAGQEFLDTPSRAFEAIALGLRRIGGMSRTVFAAEFGEDPLVRYPDAVHSAIDAALLELGGDTLRLTPRGRLLANEVLVGFAPAR